MATTKISGLQIFDNTISSSAIVNFDTAVSSSAYSSGFRAIPPGTVSSSTQASTWTVATASYTPPTFIDNLVTVGLAGSNTNYTSIKAAVDSITDASVANTYTVRVYPGVYIEDTITLKPYIAIKGDSSISTIVSASNPNNSIFVMSDQSMVIDMQIQGSTGTNTSAVMYSSPTTPQTNAIAYVENVRFGTNYTNAKVMGSGSSGNCILQCSNVKYGGFTSGSKSFDVGFYVTSGSDGGIGRMQLRNVTSTNGGVAGTDNDQIFALADAPGCTFIVNGCLLTRSTGVARGTGFKVYNGGQLRLTAVNFQRWIRGIWAPQTGSAPSIDAIALNFENCTTDVQIDHSGSLGKVSGTDTFLKTIINKDAPLYEVNQDPRRITVAKKGGDFTSISASVAYITDSAENNRYVIEVGPGEFTEKQIDLRGKPYIAINGSDIQTTVIIPSGSGTFDQLIIGPTNEVSFLTLQGNNVSGYSALSMPDVGQTSGTDFAMAHKISIYDYDYGIKVCADTANSTFYGEYIDINGMFSYGLFVSSSNNFSALTNIENYYLFPSNSSGIGNYAVGPSSSLSLYTGLFKGDNTAGSTAITIEQGASLEAAGLDMQDWDYGVRVPAASPAPEFRIVGSMIHDSNVYDFDVLNSSTRGRFQGVSDHTKINNNSPDFYWNFLDDTDGENDITRKLSVTFADGTHTDVTTLIFKGSPMGVMEGGNITTGSGFNITVASGFGYVQDAIDAAIYKRIDWVNGNLTLTANSNNYIYLTSAEVLTAAGSIPNNETNIILGRVVTNNTTIELIDQSPYNGEHMSNKLSTFNREALGPVYAAGSTVTEDITPFTLDVTAGTYFFSENKFTPVGTSSINLTQYYPSASAWARYTSSIVPSNQYASASALVAMSSSAYTKHTLYGVGEGVDEKYFLVINSNQYSTLLAAENANLPTIPTYFDDGVVALAAVYVQSGSANITQIQDIRPIIGFRAAGVNAAAVHGSLLGLSADDHTQYLLVNGARAMSGDLSLGGSNITNVGTMFGTASWANNAVNAITASAATSITFTPSTASFATSASYAPTILPIGVVSSSTQINTGSFTGSFTGTLIGTSSWASNAVVAQNGFPFTGSAIISGSLRNTGSFGVSGSTTLDGNTTVIGNLTINNTSSPTLNFTNGDAFIRYGSGEFRLGTTATALMSFMVNGNVAWYIDTSRNLVPNFNNTMDIGLTGTRVKTIWTTNISSSNPIASSSFATTSSFAVSALSASWAPTQATGSTAWTSLTGIPEGLVSSSVQINTGSFSGSFTGTLIGTSSWATTASFAISASWAPTMATGSTAWTSLTGIPEGLVSSSTQINTGSFSGSFVGTLTGTSSWATSASYVLPSGLPVGTVSSSGQVSYTGLSNVPANIVSSSAQVIAFLPTGTVSSSAQINTGSFTGSFIGIHSGSTFGTASWASNAISSSFATTSSYALSANVTLPAGVVSSSSQINTGSFTGSFIGIFSGSVFGTSSWASNVVSSSFATTASAATSITFTPATASFATTAATASSFTGYINFPNGLDVSGSLYTTGSQTTVGPVVISGSLNISGSVTASNVNLVLSGTPGPNTLLVLETTTNRVFSTNNITASLFGTSSWASNVISSSYPFAVSGSSLITANAGIRSLGISASYLGLKAGTGSSAADYSTFVGVEAGKSASYNGVYIGYQAAYDAVTSNDSVMVGWKAGVSATNAPYATFVGTTAGLLARQAEFSTFIGSDAGRIATSASDSTFIGTSAGAYATNALASTFVGGYAGYNAVSASYSTLLGYSAGYVVNSVDSMGSNNIVVGNSIGLARNAKDSINIGGIIFATGSYNNTLPGASFTGSQSPSVAKVGINIVTPRYNFDVSGSGNFTNNLTVTGSVNVISGSITVTNGEITSSLFGTSSWASNAISSSFATTASYALSAIATLPAGVVSSSQQFITLSDPFTGSFTGSFKGDGTGLTGVTATTFPFVGAAVISGSLTVTGSGITVIGGGITSSLFGTSSWASNSVSSSYPFAAGALSSLITANSGIGRPGISASYLGFGAGTASFDCDYSTFIGTAAARNGSYNSVYIGYQVAYDAVASNDSVMIGYLAGTQGGRNASNSNFIGSEAGAGAPGNFNNSNLLGYQAGYSASGAYNVVFIGDQAGFAARSAVDSTFVGDSAGFSASNAAVSTFLGSFAGYKAISASYSTFVGASAGQNATNPYNSTFIGLRTGFSASRASNSTFIGERAGELATDATGSTFIGLRAGFSASNARYSTFLGKRAGNNAVSASYSILIGDSSGYVVNSVDSMGSNNIVVGNSIGLPRNITDSINIGGIIFATGSYNNVAVQFTGSQSPSVAKVGINIVTPNYNFDVSGSGNFSNNLTVSGSLNATNGSITASNVNLVSISNTTNANSVLVLETATGKIFTTSSIGSTFPYTGNAVITGALTITGSNALNITGSATILGAFQATTKSFKIDHQILLGKKLIYGVLEGPEHGVYVRGRLTKNNIIQLPEEWEWLVDADSITVQLTSIGTQQILYVQNIENNTVVINSNTPIDCFYFVQATRKDVDTLQTVE